MSDLLPITTGNTNVTTQTSVTKTKEEQNEDVILIETAKSSSVDNNNDDEDIQGALLDAYDEIDESIENNALENLEDTTTYKNDNQEQSIVNYPEDRELTKTEYYNGFDNKIHPSYIIEPKELTKETLENLEDYTPEIPEGYELFTTQKTITIDGQNYTYNVYQLDEMAEQTVENGNFSSLKKELTGYRGENPVQFAIKDEEGNFLGTIEYGIDGKIAKAIGKEENGAYSVHTWMDIDANKETDNDIHTIKHYTKDDELVASEFYMGKNDTWLGGHSKKTDGRYTTNRDEIF